MSAAFATGEAGELARLGATGDARRLREALEELGPTFVKFGQMRAGSSRKKPASGSARFLHWEELPLLGIAGFVVAASWAWRGRCSRSNRESCETCRHEGRMKRLWILAAQAVTAGVVVFVLAALIAPESLPWRARTVVIGERAGPAASERREAVASYSVAALRAVPSVVNVYAAKAPRPGAGGP